VQIAEPAAAAAVALEINGILAAMLVWTTLKLQIHWRLFTPPEPSVGEKIFSGVKRIYIATLGSLFSMFLAIVVGYCTKVQPWSWRIPYFTAFLVYSTLIGGCFEVGVAPRPWPINSRAPVVVLRRPAGSLVTSGETARFSGFQLAYGERPREKIESFAVGETRLMEVY
jgi:hypothetical protein